MPTLDDLMAKRGLRTMLDAAPGMGDAPPWVPGRPAAEAEPAAELTITEQILATDEPLCVMALPAEVNQWGVFLGAKMIQNGGPMFALDWAAATERWRAAVRAQRAADAEHAAPDRA